MKKIVRMSAGLANRMFQYSYYKFLEKKGYDVYVDNNYKASKWKMEDIEWEKIFPYAKLRQAPSNLVFRYGGGYTFLDKIRRHYVPFLNRVLFLENATSIPTEEELEKYGYFIGTFQESKIAESVKDILYNCFTFKDFAHGSMNNKYKIEMESQNSVSIHIRRGEDYLKKVVFQNTCPLSYYYRAIEIIKSKVSNPVFYVFTDNPNWVKDNLTDFEYVLIGGNPTIGWGNHFDMQLMSFCKHNIIANSTYSWWGAFLNPNPHKIVIDPTHWFNPEIDEYRRIPNKTACEGWILL